MGRLGFVLTLDALTAILLLVSLVYFISFEINVPQEITFLPKFGQDFLAVLDKSEMLLNITKLSQPSARAAVRGFVDLVPANIGANLTIEIYEYRPAHSDFLLRDSFNAVRGTPAEDRVAVRRVFVNKESELYSRALLELWYE